MSRHWTWKTKVEWYALSVETRGIANQTTCLSCQHLIMSHVGEKREGSKTLVEGEAEPPAKRARTHVESDKVPPFSH